MRKLLCILLRLSPPRTAWFCGLSLTLLAMVVAWPLGNAAAQSGALSWRIETIDEAVSQRTVTLTKIDATGSLHAVYQVGIDGPLRYASQLDGPWRVETIRGNGYPLLLDADTEPRVILYNAASRTIEDARRVAGAWTTEQWGSPLPADHHPTPIVLDQAGNPHFLTEVPAGPDELRYVRWSGSEWIVEPVTTIASIGWHSALALDVAGRAHFSFADWRGLFYAHHNGDRWQVERLDIPGSPGHDIWQNTLALGTDSMPQIAFYDHGCGCLGVARKRSGGWLVERVDDTTDDGGRDPTLALADDRRPHVVYVNVSVAGEASVRYTRWDGNRWALGTVVRDRYGVVGGTATWPGPPVLALDADDQPHIVYPDRVAHALRYATAVPTGDAVRLAFASAPVRAPAGMAFGLQPQVVVQDAEGRTITSESGRQVTLRLKAGTGDPHARLYCHPREQDTYEAPVEGGLALFSGCFISVPGTGYVLEATAPGLTGAETRPFNVTLAGDANGDCRVDVADFSR